MSSMGNILKYLGAAIHAEKPVSGKKVSSPAPPSMPAPAPPPQQPIPTPSQMPLGQALKLNSQSNLGQATPPQGPVDLPLREFFALVKGDAEKAEELIPGITQANQLAKLLKLGPDGTPHVTVDPNKLAQTAQQLHGPPPQQPPMPTPGQPSDAGTNILQQAGLPAHILGVPQ